ncbi:molybdopterin/thiamine adenylyltransferase [Hamiltosporidium magnivora]|uniref:Molybdopterin/thiamine adenylyltransferase n=1 Tax=Hamiltosporidium magnivora TaxID=148818 RepID=A0A4Q9LBF8_9MICR|nr:molybdopterin/thiamine adenylyltransferase [Hamiltosporidium magnivora]
MLYTSELTNSEIQRYSRQIILPEISVDGQIKIRNSKVLVVGLGGLGSPVVSYLATAGVGTLGLLDYDVVEFSNLQRQTIHSERTVSKDKTKSAFLHLKRLNSRITIREHSCMIGDDNANKIIAQYDIILDCCDNITSRYSINDNCKLLGKKYICASVLKWEGQIFVFADDGPCYRCLFPDPKNDNMLGCAESGVLGPMCGVIGSLQAVEALKLILDSCKSFLLTYNGYENIFKKVEINQKSERCLVCTEKKIPPSNFGTCKNQIMRVSIDDKYKIKWKDFLASPTQYLLVDIRNKILYDMCHIQNSVNVPADTLDENNEIFKDKRKILFLCKKGISAQKVAAKFLEKGKNVFVVDGGLTKFKSEIDLNFPLV